MHERSAAGEGVPFRSQRWQEVFRGDGLAVSFLAEFPRATLTAYYVLRPLHIAIPEQAAAIGIARRDYWRFLEIGEAAVDTGLQVAARLQARMPANGSRL